MKNWLSILICVVFIASAQAQKKPSEGKVVYELSYEKQDSTQKVPKPSNAVVYFSKNMLRMEMNTGSGYESVTIFDMKAKKSIMLIELAGKKYAIENNKADRKTAKEVKKSKPITYVDETKMIAGYPCKRADIQLKKNLYSVYYTEEIESRNATFNSPLYEIDGFLMEFWVNSNNQNVKMSAKEINTEPVDKKLFEIPADFIYTTREELRHMFQSK
ncbi:MAG: DUF4412 domain-containing protein [Bacteroidia bacterium]|nr:DUF4412 domain-containing protein [Bacteroidia bacterium]NNM16422.1 DUF4412 domain-containing protein [Bacteroidia bacterium]